MFSGCTEGAEPGAGASANADLSCIIQGRAGEGTRTKIPVGEGSSPGSRALDSQLWSLCWWKQVGRAVTTPSFLTSSPQTVLRIVVLGIWDYIENKIEVKTVSLAPPEPAILEAEVSLAPPSQPSWRLECPSHPRASHPGSWKLSLSYPSQGGSHQQRPAASHTGHTSLSSCAIGQVGRGDD